MPSPFPGMDPYLEGYLWPDVHSALASKIRQQLTPLLRPKYAARLEVYLAEDPFPEGEIGILYSDVEVVETQQPPVPPSPGSTLTIMPATLKLPVMQAVQVRLTIGWSRALKFFRQSIKENPVSRLIGGKDSGSIMQRFTC